MTDETVHLDEQTLRALDHPLRQRLLARLRTEGPGTASGLAQWLGESSGLTSYHLRKLAAAGLVEEEDRESRRERWWRAVHQISSFSPAELLGDPAAHRATVALRRQIYRWQQRLLDQWLAEEQEWDEAWVAAADSSDAVLRLTAERARALADEVEALVERYRRSPDEGGERVVWIHHLVPLRGELPL